MAILINIFLGVFVLVALLMVLIILMQRPKSEGLGAAFGGGVTDNIFGAQTTNVLTKITGWLAGMFFLLTFVLSMLYAHQTNTSGRLRQQLEKDGAAAATVPASGPVATGAVGAPNTVTNPTPGAESPVVAPAEPPTAADLAVGITAPVAPLDAPAPAADAPADAGSAKKAPANSEPPAPAAQPSP
ncbi:MAG: preprotein translocase subunit SecG [Chthoniobacterales bacterium]